MKTRKLIAASLVVALTGLFISCSDDDTTSCVPDYTGALSEQESGFTGTWKLTAIESSKELDLTDDDEDNPTTDIFIQQTDCQNDISYTYGTDRSYIYEVGENAEDCTNARSGTGTWKLGGNSLGVISACYEDIQNLEFNTERNEYKIQNTGTGTDVNGKSFQIIVTYTFTKELADVEPAD
ncbi:MAG: DUF5004 domain-containing protein [Galbibacter orientalis]|uniref:DUF5004 domain-containing protein n=1 Tax=Galbibacter orientalis TaxID=453852 RepID=UPI003001D050